MKGWCDRRAELRMFYPQMGLLRRGSILVQVEDGPKVRILGDQEKLNQGLVEYFVLNGQ